MLALPSGRKWSQPSKGLSQLSPCEMGDSRYSRRTATSNQRPVVARLPRAGTMEAIFVCETWQSYSSNSSDKSCTGLLVPTNEEVQRFRFIHDFSCRLTWKIDKQGVANNIEVQTNRRFCFHSRSVVNP